MRPDSRPVTATRVGPEIQITVRATPTCKLKLAEGLRVLRALEREGVSILRRMELKN